MDVSLLMLAESAMPTDAVSAMLQMGITGIVMVCCGVFLHMLLKFYREIRAIEQSHHVTVMNNLSQCISQASDMAKALAATAPIIANVVAEAHELVRETKDLSDAMLRQRN